MPDVRLPLTHPWTSARAVTGTIPKVRPRNTALRVAPLIAVRIGSPPLGPPFNPGVTIPLGTRVLNTSSSTVLPPGVEETVPKGSTLPRCWKWTFPHFRPPFPFPSACGAGSASPPPARGPVGSAASTSLTLFLPPRPPMTWNFPAAFSTPCRSRCLSPPGSALASAHTLNSPWAHLLPSSASRLRLRHGS